MLAARDQENLVHKHQQNAAGKPLNQATKTPGNRYPKTPIKIPLHDENAPAGLGGKSVLAAKGKELDKLDRNAFVTPMGPRTRAPLGQKTTNAKAKAFQTPSAKPDGLKDNSPQKTQQVNPTTTRKPRLLSKPSEKLIPIPSDQSPLHKDADEDDVPEPEYCPPKPKDLPYESEVFPDGCLNYQVFKGKNFMRGWQDIYHGPRLDEDGKTEMDRQCEADRKKSLDKTDEMIRKAMEDPELWTVGDVPETFHFLKERQKGMGMEEKQKKVKFAAAKPAVKKADGSVPQKPIPTITARKAASALSSQPAGSRPTTAALNKPISSTASNTKPPFLSGGKKPALSSSSNTTRPTPANPNLNPIMRHTSAIANSRNTIGYTKGRSASNIVSNPRNISTQSGSSSTTLRGSSTGTKGDSVSMAKGPIARLGGGAAGRGPIQRSVSTMSGGSDATITQERFENENGSGEEWIERLRGMGLGWENEDEIEAEAGLRGNAETIEWEEDSAEVVLRVEDFGF